jgi:hypothetical protein
MGLIEPGYDEHPEAIAWAAARYLDTAPAMRKVGEALYPDWPGDAEEAHDATASTVNPSANDG